MDFNLVIDGMVGAFDRAGVRYALIGGMAIALRGIQRSTLDLDFIVATEDLPAADPILRGLGYTRVFHSANVSQYGAEDPALGRIDILHAFRGPSLGMLQRAERMAWPEGPAVPVVHWEDLIGLKIQAMVNDPGRALRDWADIHEIVRFAAGRRMALDWELLADYLELFDLHAKLLELKLLYQSQAGGGV